VNPVLVLLDIDGTLLTAFGEGRSAYYDALGEMFPGATYPVLGMAGRTDFGIWCELTGEGAGERWDRFRLLYAGTMERRLRTRPPALFPGVGDLCRALCQDERFRPGIVTGNFEGGTRVKLRHGGLDPWLGDVPGAYGDRDVDKDRLAREVLDGLAARGEERPRTVVVGDTLADLRCARGADAACLGVLTGGDTREELSGAQAVLPDLSDTETVLEILWKIAL
jgi:phosphoglycolate phosphatase